MTFEPHPVADRLIGCAIRVHTALGPGLLESTYKRCLCCELDFSGIRFKTEVVAPLIYRNVRLDCGYRIDILVEDSLVVEVKATDTITPIHKAQVLTYLKLTGARQGLILNFNSVLLKDGIRSVVLNQRRESRSIHVPDASPSQTS